jgi:hypothetical protein
MKPVTCFVLQYHSWEKTAGSTSTPPIAHWDLRLDIPHNPGLTHFYLLENPTKTTKLKAVMKHWAERKWLTEEGKYPPGTSVNPSKDLPAVIKNLDRGPIIIKEDKTQFKEIEFRGSLLKGTWRLTRDQESENWIMKKTDRKVAT